MTEKNEYTAVPTAVLADDRERKELEYISDMARRNREAETAIRRNMSKALEAEEAARSKRIATRVNLVCEVCAWIVGSASLLILAHIGAIAGWLMQIAITAWTGCAGYRVGVLLGCCKPRQTEGRV